MSRVGERVVVHGLLEVQGIENLDLIPVLLQRMAAGNHDVPFRVLSIRIEKKVNYFYEVTTSD